MWADAFHKRGLLQITDYKCAVMHAVQHVMTACDEHAAQLLCIL